ncbi:hypothetical protein M378DRAFT_11273 [Amanita muscaria Koide BX008]|uniref:Uncharacterized protein n=1 Tax=Amanita muscaria (strain Koide BX008) TaxID=946122 RepID=A0A0C2X607_AMAMK|nr:hypothetical protein M378DRAFT_11273 [Amanita muscaria Koide BX008]
MLPLIALLALILVSAMCFQSENAVQLFIEQTIVELFSHVDTILLCLAGPIAATVPAHPQNRSTPLGMGVTSGYDDFDVTRIDNDTRTSTQFNGVFRKHQFTLRSCQHGVMFNDQIHWAFSNIPFSELDDPCVTITNASIQLIIADGSIGSPVDGQVNDASGHFTTFGSAGIERMKTDENDSIRSNASTTAVS